MIPPNIFNFDNGFASALYKREQAITMPTPQTADAIRALALAIVQNMLLFGEELLKVTPFHFGLFHAETSRNETNETQQINY
jgi:hypothetical protein